MATRNVPSTYASIQAAVDAAADNDLILVASGYAGNESVDVTVDGLTFSAPADVVNIVLNAGAGVANITLAGASAIAVYGNDLFVTTTGDGKVGQFDATNGGPVGTGSSFITGLSGPFGIVVIPTPTITQVPVPPAPVTITITGKKKVITIKPAVRVKGVTTGKVTSVTYRVGKKAFKPAVGTSAWTFKAKRLKVGKNLITVIAKAANGATATAKVRVIRKVVAP